MRKFLFFNGKRLTGILFYIFLIILLSGCGGGGGDGDVLSSGPSDEPSGTGSVSFNLAWYDAPAIQASENIIMSQATPVPVDCGIIQHIICEVYDSSNTFLTSETFDCSDGTGTVNNIPAGENREFVVLGVDFGGNILNHGLAPGITILSNQTINVGTIEVFPFYISPLLSPPDGSPVPSDQLSLSWAPVENAYAYRVQVSQDIDFNPNALDIDETTANIPYTPSGLSVGTTYYWKVFALDIHGNQGVESTDVWSFTVNEPGSCTYSISPPSRSFTSSEGAGSINVTAPSGCSWSATESVDWIAITSGSSGSGNGTLTYTVSANTTESSRTATITVAGETQTVTHTVTQEPPVPGECTTSISPSSLSFTSSEGAGSISVTSPSGCSWTATEGVDWINITSGSSGSGDGTVTYEVSANTTESSRTAIITVAGETQTVTHTVTQEPPVPGCDTASISPPSQTFNSSGGPGSISVTAPGGCSWNASASVDWIDITSGSGSGNGTVTYTVSDNTTGNPRTAVITVAGQNHTVTQEPCTYSISPSSQSFNSSGGAGSISVTSSASGCIWNVSESVDWIDITSGSSGNGNGTVTYTVSANTTGSSRTAVITVAGQTHTVTQEPCTYSISPPNRSFDFNGGTGSISVTSSETTCSWTATRGCRLD